jgi:hypothetical protein
MLPFIDGRKASTTFGDGVEIATFGRMRNEQERTLEMARRRLANYAAPGGPWEIETYRKPDIASSRP